MSSSEPSSASALLSGTTQPSDKLMNRGYLSLLVAQFLGAANDNVLKQCLTLMMVGAGIWKDELGPGGQAAPALCLTLPFILLSGYAGQIADKASKQQVIFWVKVAEVPIALVTLYGFWQQEFWVSLFGLLLLSTQSAFFGPAKYGVIPELVTDRHLSQANGVINMCTNIAIILGTFMAGILCDLYQPKQPDQTPLLWVPGAAMVTIAVVGLIASLWVPKLAAADPGLRFSMNPVGTYFTALREMARSPLLTVALAWSGFYMIGMLALLIVPDYKGLLQLETDFKASLLTLSLAVAIGAGSLTAGFVSGDRIRPRLVPMGAVGMTFFFFLLGTVPPEYYSVGAMIFCTGFFAGFYIVPLQALLQHLSPDDERGRFLGAANALSFCFMTFGSLIFWFVRNKLGMPANRVHLICGILAAIGTIIGIWRLRQLEQSAA